MTRRLLAVLLLSGASLGCGSSDTSPPEDANAGPTPTEPNLKVAFIGDQGVRPESVAVLELIKNEGAHMVIHAGDFDYLDDPTAWDDQITSVLGDDYPYFASIGNHDIAKWEGYRAKLETRLSKIQGAECVGEELGVRSACTYRGLFFILSGVGTWGFFNHLTYLEEALDGDRSLWRVCDWHKNREDMQVGTKGDEVPWEAYQLCQNKRAIIATAHEHSYGRTLTLTDVGNRGAGHGATGEPDKMRVAEGRSFVFVSAIGGQSLREYSAELHDDDTWWATIFAGGHHLLNGVPVQNVAYDYGALFIEFHVDGDPRKARGYLKTIQGEIADEFTVETEP